MTTVVTYFATDGARVVETAASHRDGVARLNDIDRTGQGVGFANVRTDRGGYTTYTNRTLGKGRRRN